jgi:hypothetical protein
LGFIPRTGIIKSGTSAQRTFYPKTGIANSHSFRLLNLMWFQQNLDYQKTDHNFEVNYTLEFKKQDRLEFEFSRQYIYLSSSFDPTRSTNSIPLPGDSGYQFSDWSLNYQSNLANPFIFTSEVSYGGFYNGTRFSYRGSTGYRFQPKVILSLQWDYNRINLPKPYATADLILVRPKFDVTFSKNLFWSTLIQYSNQTDNLGINSRLQWRFAPLSDLYIVYNDNYYTREFGPTFRSINLKLTYWLNL